MLIIDGRRVDTAREQEQAKRKKLTCCEEVIAHGRTDNINFLVLTPLSFLNRDDAVVFQHYLLPYYNLWISGYFVFNYLSFFPWYQQYEGVCPLPSFLKTCP